MNFHIRYLKFFYLDNKLIISILLHQNFSKLMSIQGHLFFVLNQNFLFINHLLVHFRSLVNCSFFIYLFNFFLGKKRLFKHIQLILI